MKKFNPITVVVFLFLTTLLTSCEAISGIFNAGMTFGIFIVVFIIVAIAVFVMRRNRNS